MMSDDITVGTAADDDSGVDTSTNPSGTPPNSDGSSGDTNSTPALPTDDNLIPASVDNSDADDVTTVNTNGSDNTPPGKRMNNPLGQYASVDYILSLYMVSPDAYTAFVKSGYKNVNALRDAVSPDNPNLKDSQGAFLIAQSGGVNNSQAAQRAPYFGFDYYIDNLKFDAVFGPKGSGAPAAEYTMTFDVTEPMGFSFVSNLRKAALILSGNSVKSTTPTDSSSTKSSTKNSPKNALRQHFIMGIKFNGYDINGNILTSGTPFDGGILDPSGSHNDTVDTFEYYYDITITNFEFELKGGPSVYHMTAQPTPYDKALGSADGTTLDTQSITANTVKEAVNKLMSNQTKAQKKQKDKGDRNEHSTFNIRWEPGTEVIQNATIVSPADLDKSKWSGSGAKNSTESNQKTATKSKSNNKARTIHIGNGMSVVQALNNIIQQSSYLRDALKVVYDSDIQSNDTTKDYNQQPGGDNPQISWFHVTPQLLNPKWDTKTNSWAYDMTYVITKYDTPVTDSVYANKKTGTNYPGPFKRYKYWYTGENTEVLSFGLEFKQSYYTNVVSSVDSDQNNSSPSNGTQQATDPTEVPKVPGTQTNQSRTGGKGPAMEAQNNYLTSLYDPNAYGQGKISIMGDPDWIISPNAAAPDAVYSKYYNGKSNQVNPQSGQPLVEVDIVEAVDYDTGGTGLMSLNESVFFFPIPSELAKATDSNGDPVVQGIPYAVNSVVNKFSGGRFTQDLSMVMDDLRRFLKPENPKSSGKAPKKAKSTTKNTGTVQDVPWNQTDSGATFGVGYLSG